MFQTPPSIFQSILCASIKDYEKKTKKDLITHLLMAELQACKSPTDILSVLHTQVHRFEQSTDGDDKYDKMIEPDRQCPLCVFWSTYRGRLTSESHSGDPSVI
jgi:hypothetical protein